MSEIKPILNIEKPQTQTVAAVKALLAWRGHPTNELPTDVSLENGRMVLVLSNKRDCYYVTTAADCSCPAHNWHPGQRCKHQRRYFPDQQATTRPQAAIKQHNHGAWHGHNGPIAPEETRAAKAASPLYVDTTPEATPGELAYWNIQHDREMWPCEA